MSEANERPDAVPPEAEWSDEDSEWIVGGRNANGEYEGEVHYWRPDGTLVCIAQLLDGKPHGSGSRFHENGEVSQTAEYHHGELNGLRTWTACEEATTELMHTPGMGEEIWRVEVHYDMGRPRKFRWFLRDGTEVERDGEPLVTRPEGVPEDAIHNPKNDHWMAGVWNADGEKDGAMRVFRADGSPLSIETYAADVVHGTFSLFYDEGGLRTRREYVHGIAEGSVEYFYRSGEIARRGVLGDGRWQELVDLAPDGAVLREVATPKLDAGPTVARPNEADIAFIDALDDDERPAGDLSPAGLAAVIAIAWSGDSYRNVYRARAARSFVRSHPDSAIREVLADVGLDTAPRLMTSARLERLCDGLARVDLVDVDALRIHLAAEGGVGAFAALSQGGAGALEFLRSRLNDSGRLDLQRLALTELPSVIRHLPLATEIEASHNAITSVGPDIADLVMLSTLRLSGNRVKDLAPELARLFELRSLHLADNAMPSLPAALMSLPELEVLNLGGNELAEIPDAFADLERLDTLWLHDNPLKTLPTSFGRLSSLTFLHLGQAEWEQPPACLWELENLETLWIASSDLQRLPPDVARLENLRELMVWYSSLTSVPDELFEMTQLRELRIRDNPLPDGTIERLKEALPNCTIY